MKTATLKVARTLIPAAILTAGLLWTIVTPSFANPEYAKKEGKECAYCHVSAGKTELNAAGAWYAAHNHTLEGYEAVKP